MDLGRQLLSLELLLPRCPNPADGKAWSWEAVATAAAAPPETMFPAAYMILALVFAAINVTRRKMV
jgi:hypothetical protein